MNVAPRYYLVSIEVIVKTGHNFLHCHTKEIWFLGNGHEKEMVLLRGKT
jgi:hypothetical protein